MTEIGVRRLRAEVAAAVRRAEAGEELVITVGGRPVARLGPLSGAVGGAGQVRLADLVATGAVVARRRTDPYRPPPPVPVWPGVRLDQLLRDLRG